MPLYHCDDCHHEFEGAQAPLRCDWCGSSAYVLAEKTELETCIETLVTEPSKLPTFYCQRSLLGYSGHGQQDLNRVKLYGPCNFEFTIIEIGEARDAKIDARLNELAKALSKLWETRDENA